MVGALLDAEAAEEFITNLILSVRSLLPVDKLVDEVEKRHRLKLLTPFLEHLISEGSVDPHVHNALGELPDLDLDFYSDPQSNKCVVTSG